jgi:hypothetical protein
MAFEISRLKGQELALRLARAMQSLPLQGEGWEEMVCARGDRPDIAEAKIE